MQRENAGVESLFQNRNSDLREPSDEESGHEVKIAKSDNLVLLVRMTTKAIKRRGYCKRMAYPNRVSDRNSEPARADYMGTDRTPGYSAHREFASVPTTFKE